jgi:cellulose synthase/poly-beta-1,6-N-acetylglucosamine synthase-like glycosyltransferase
LLKGVTDEALLRTAEIKRLAKPLSCDFEYLREWLERPQAGNHFLRGIEADAWRPEHLADLVVLSRPPKDRDRFAQFMSDTVVPWFHRRIGHKLLKPVSESKVCDTWEYNAKIFVFLGNFICMLLSAIVPSISIFVLCFLESMIARLSVVTAMSFIFSVIMTFIVQGRRVDVFAATTAFAAVQVVFLGGQNNPPVA